MEEKHLKNIEREQSQDLLQQQEKTDTKTLEFSSVEDLIRHDASNIKVPETLWERIKKSISQLNPKVPFWKRLFKK